MYNAVGIDVSKGKGTVAVLRPGGVMPRKPFDVPHTSGGLNELPRYLGALEGDTRVVMECTGRYHEPNGNNPA
jgi:transposase